MCPYSKETCDTRCALFNIYDSTNISGEAGSIERVPTVIIEQRCTTNNGWIEIDPKEVQQGDVR
jgi:hypothetical protein